MRRIGIALICVLALGAGCSGKPEAGGPAPEASTVLTPTAAATTEATATGKPKPGASPASWPTPADCTSHNPATVVKQYEAGIHTIRDGSKILMRFHGGPAENIGDQGLALAKRFRTHCFIGRGNTRTEEKNRYIFDYWLDPTGSTPTIPDMSCSDYNRNNLNADDMGGGDGWRVKDHDNVLHVFDNETDARNGKLVLAKYNRICRIGEGSDEEDQDIISYFL